MLTCYKFRHHTFRTNRLALLCLRGFRDSQTPPLLPILDWTPGESARSSLEEPESPENIPSRRGRRHKPRDKSAAQPEAEVRSEAHDEVDLGPSLDWYPGERNVDFSTSRQSLHDFDFQQPRLPNWLAPKREKAPEKEPPVIRKLESRPGSSKRSKGSLITRVVLDIDPDYEPEGRPLVRRVGAVNWEIKERELSRKRKGEKAEPKIAQEPLDDLSTSQQTRVRQDNIERLDTEPREQEGSLIRRKGASENPQQTFAVPSQGIPVIRKTLVQSPTISRAPRVSFIRQKGHMSAAALAENMEGQNSGDVGVNSIEESEKEGIVNETIPNDTNLIGEVSGQASQEGKASEAEGSTTEAAQKPHDLKRANLGSYQKAPLNDNKKSKKRKVQVKEVKEGSNEVVLGYEIKDLLSSLNIESLGDAELPERDAGIKLTVSKLSSTGEGLAVYNNRVYTVPFGVPGDQVTATVRKHNDDHSVSKILSIDKPSPDRDDSIVGCKYFTTCNGCQFQMLPYAVQLEHKRTVVQRAFKNFSNLSPDLLPEIGATMPSPLQYGYRTKLTPHFNGPRKGGFKAHMPVPNIGFFAKDPAYVMDIEDCPIGTDTVREGITERRNFVKENLLTAFKRGATLLLRESTVRTYLDKPAEDGKKWVDKKLCITDHNARSIEYIGDLKFDNSAGSFFQNNNSILESFTAYIRENLNLPVVKKAEGASEVTETTERPKYLVDAYCGSGLFSITCGEGLEKVWGIDVDKSSIVSARENAKANNIKNAAFIDSPAENIFGKLTFPGSETSLIIDPPRKGCDKPFLDQLLDFAPKRIVYVSCNVHTQARDIGYILSDERSKGYRIDSIRGCDFFPQTYHVEGVAVMTKID